MSTCKTVQLGPKDNRGDHDFYATDPMAVGHLLLTLKENKITLAHNIMEPSVGMGHIAEVLTYMGYGVFAYDIVDRGYPNTVVQDFLTVDRPCEEPLSIIMNPPYCDALEHLVHALNLLRDGEICCALLRLQFLEGIKRKIFFQECPMRYVAVFSFRIKCNKNNDPNFMSGRGSHSAVAFAWFIWVKGYKGNPEIIWI